MVQDVGSNGPMDWLFPCAVWVGTSPSLEWVERSPCVNASGYFMCQEVSVLNDLGRLHLLNGSRCPRVLNALGYFYVSGNLHVLNDLGRFPLFKWVETSPCVERCVIFCDICREVSVC